MNFLIVVIAILSLTCKTNRSKVVTSDTASFADPVSKVRKSFNDTSSEKLKAGFYLAIPDTSNLSGYKLHNKKEYYFLGPVPAVTLNEIDSVYIEFNSQIDGYFLILKFNDTATEKWFDFTTRNNGMQVGLVLNNEIFHVATIASPISSGRTALTIAQTEKELDEFKALLEKEIKKSKGL